MIKNISKYINKYINCALIKKLKSRWSEKQNYKFQNERNNLLFNYFYCQSPYLIRDKYLLKCIIWRVKYK